MKYSDLEQLVDNMLKDIFKDKEMNLLSKYDQSYVVYKYLTEHIQFDYSLWEIKKAKDFTHIPNPHQQVVDIFLKHKGYCSAIAQAYKLLLEKLDIPILIVVGYDDGDGHQFNLVNRSECWSFDDVTRGIILPDERTDNFDYDNLEEKKQVFLGILPEEVFDNIYGRVVSRENLNLKRNEQTGVYELPENIRSVKQDQIGVSPFR